MLKRVTPRFLHSPIRILGAVVLGPWLFVVRTCYFRSAIKQAAVDSSGDPIPWFTYPAIDFLRTRRYDGKRVLEFGGAYAVRRARRRVHSDRRSRERYLNADS